MATKIDAFTKQHLNNWLQDMVMYTPAFDEVRDAMLAAVIEDPYLLKECGLNNGCIERDEETGKTFWLSSVTGKRWPVADLETGARKRLENIINTRNGRDRAIGGPDCTRQGEVSAYIQGDPRGAALYIIRPGDVPEGADVNSYYSRGICVY